MYGLAGFTGTAVLVAHRFRTNSRSSRTAVLVRDHMEAAWELEVPLVVDQGWGKDWLEAH